MTLWLLVALLGCSQSTASMSDAGLPESVFDVVGDGSPVAPLQPTLVDGLTWFEGPLGSRPMVIVAVPNTATAGELHVWSHYLRASLASATGTPTDRRSYPGAEVFVFDTTEPLVPNALTALVDLPMDDVAIANALLNRPDDLGAVRPDGLRALHAVATTRSHVSVRSSAAPSEADRQLLQRMQPGQPKDQPDAIIAILATP